MRHKLRRLALAAASVLAVSCFGAQAQETPLGFQFIPSDNGTRSEARAEQIVTSLMQPVMPFIDGRAEQTTTIAQLGTANYASSFVEGAGNLSLIAQGGSNNRAVQTIQGNSSALLLAQGGTNNSVLQASVGNQNFQLVGVSGNNNNVGYVQIGDGLAGALDVRGANNANVFALQTPDSSRYLMPSGLRGLQNATVVIVPGKMYVFRR